MQRTRGVCFSTEAFEKMKRLRLLQLDHVQVAGDYGRLPKKLRWVHWKAFSLTHIPENFYQKNIVAIDLKYSSLKLVWRVPQVYIRTYIFTHYMIFSMMIIPIWKKAHVLNFLAVAGGIKISQS